MKDHLFTAGIAIFIFWLSIINSFGQAPVIQWQKALGGSGADLANSIVQTNDGGYIVAGGSNSTDGDVIGSHGDQDYWVVKLNDTGDIDWQKALGGTGVDQAFSIEQTTDGGYIIAGESNSTDGDISGNHGGYDYWVVKLNNMGTLEWQKALGGTGIDRAISIRQTTDGGYIVAGRTNSTDGDVTGLHGDQDDYWVVKLTDTGDIDWQKALGGTGVDQAFSIDQTTDGGYIVAGSSWSTDGDVTGNQGLTDYWVVKLTGTGTLEWQRSFGGTSFDDASSIKQTADGGYIVTGETFSTNGDVTGNHGVTDQWVVKLTVTGDIEWQKALGGTIIELSRSIIQTTDGSYIVAGTAYSSDGDVIGNHGPSDQWVVKLTTTGAIDWQKAIGGTGNDQASSIEQTADGGYILAGSSTSNNGDATTNYGIYDYWVVKFSSAGPIGVENYSRSISCSIYPNPASASIWIETSMASNGVPYRVMDMAGRTVLHGILKEETTRVDVSQLVGGVYFVQVQGFIPEKLIKQ